PRDASPPVEAPAFARPPSPFVLPVQLDQTSLVGCFQGERLLVASAAELQEWDGRGSNALRRVALPPGRGLRRAYGLLALGPERVLIGGEGFELYEWTSRAGFRALGLPDVQALERLGDRAAYGLDSGELGVFALGATLLEEPPATLDLGERDTAEVLDLAWLSPTRLLAVTGGRTARDLSPSARAVQESMGALYLLDYDPAAGALTTLQREGVLGAQNVAVSGGGAPQVLVGTSTGHLFLWRLGAGAGGGERLVAAGESYRAPGAPLKVRDVLFVRETLALGALVVRAGVDPAAWAYAEGVLVYDLADAQPRVFTVPGVAPRGLLFEPEGEQVIVLGDHGRARVVALEAILEGAQPLDR
ncbi:MAG: hypothetical protein KDD82_19135, partial [Planctomycetes bacterium]|nr:hypothetical protein [Planctomycetota bacterium]